MSVLLSTQGACQIVRVHLYAYQPAGSLLTFIIYLIGTREVEFPFLSVLNNFCNIKVRVLIIRSYKVSFRRAFLGLVSDAFSPASNAQPQSEAF
jgi:hypothetical protein